MAVSKKLENPFTGVSAPTNLYIGRVWHEVTIAGLYLGSWIWNGGYWLSLQTFSHYVTTASVATTTSLIYALDPNYNVFVTNAIATILSNVTATATINWAWTLARIPVDGVGTSFSVTNNVGQVAGTWATFKTPINLYFPTSATRGIRLLETRTGNINKAGSIGFEYRRVKP